jgi:hypothetical protein
MLKGGLYVGTHKIFFEKKFIDEHFFQKLSRGGLKKSDVKKGFVDGGAQNCLKTKKTIDEHFFQKLSKKGKRK